MTILYLSTPPMIKIIVGFQDLNHPQSNVLAENAVKQGQEPVLHV